MYFILKGIKNVCCYNDKPYLFSVLQRKVISYQTYYNEVYFYLISIILMTFYQKKKAFASQLEFFQPEISQNFFISKRDGTFPCKKCNFKEISLSIIYLIM